MRPVLRSCLIVGLLAAAFADICGAAPRTPIASRVPAESPDQARVIVTFKADASVVRQRPLSAHADRATALEAVQRRADALTPMARVALTGGRPITERMQVLTASGLSSRQLVQRLAAHPDVESVFVDGRKRAFMVPNDPFYATGPTVNNTARTGGPASGQWYLRAPTSDVPSSINMPGAWDITSGAGVVVAVLDTGVYKAHDDLSGRLLGGYDFITDLATANDGSARDGDASDPGDWITGAENSAGTFSGCGVEDSSWHGTKVSAIIGAATNNGLGMAGIAHGAQVLPVRVLGKCGGYDSDILAGMRWAAGLAVPGVTTNLNPAKVLNMSFGSEATATSCNGYTEAIAAVNAAGAVVVVAAGNSNGLAVGSPANCPGAIAVGGLRHAGTKVGFSDLGPEIAISAPAGNCVNTSASSPCLYAILTAANSGTTSPVAGGSSYTNAFGTATFGTSFSTPMVAGVAALLLAARPGLAPADVKNVLQRTARPFPTSGADNGPGDPTPVTACVAPNGSEQLQCYCTSALCGAGMLDAAAAVSAAAQAPVASIAVSPASPAAGGLVTLSAAASTAPAGRSITRWQWTLLNGGGIVTGFSSSTTAATASLTPTAAGNFIVRLTVTDNVGISASSDVAVTVAAAAVNPGGGSNGDGSSGSSSGGGATSPAWLLGILVAAMALWRQQARRGQSAR